MNNVLLFLHVLSALLLGSYVVFPFVAGRAASLSGAAQTGFLGLLSTLNRIGQFSLIVVFLTGGGMIHAYEPPVSWMITAVVLLLIIGAVTGMMGSRIKKALTASKAGGSISADAGKVRTYSWIAAIAVIAAIFVMTNSSLF
ncbi:hypothetical protein B5M42_008680 [Paenibacillus athensensis]|uniref:DUF2269 family protein n=1 Tax=Paenibacillus athensensis TaxID=1967502 RepID=A0A4Y8QAD3_9BACL|nr:hypothetical protein [Paenibacillus athensensis]MCD1258910.1 hypothetical protein [Paenibacillus athensensis]